MSTRSVCHGSTKPSDFSNSNDIWDIKYINSVFNLSDTTWFEVRFFSDLDSIFMKSFGIVQLFRKQVTSFTPTLLLRKRFATQKLDVKSFGICARMPLVNAEAGQWAQMTTSSCKPDCLPAVKPTLTHRTGQNQLIFSFLCAVPRRGEEIPGFLPHFPL